MSRQFRHEPVMVAEVVAALAAAPDGLVLDATIGGGGHAAALLAARPGWRLVGLDRDVAAVSAAQARLAEFGDRVRVVKAAFASLDEVLAELAPGLPLSAALFDLGVSSHQLDTASRGFSYRQDAPLDMRMDQSSGVTAAELCNSLDERELAALFAAHGEERFARRIARAVVAARPLQRTSELAEVVAGAVPAAARRRGHPARRVFQALRVAVNDELGQLPTAISRAAGLLARGGRIAVLSYHSGEDRLVKTLFADLASGGCTCPPGLPCVCGAVSDFAVVSRGSRRATPAEAAANPRSESARLRVLERLREPAGGEPSQPHRVPR